MRKNAAKTATTAPSHPPATDTASRRRKVCAHPAERSPEVRTGTKAAEWQSPCRTRRRNTFFQLFQGKRHLTSATFPSLSCLESVNGKISSDVPQEHRENRGTLVRHGVPFALTIPAEPKTLDSMTTAELNAKLQHSYEQSLSGAGRPFDQVFDELERSLAR